MQTIKTNRGDSFLRKSRVVSSLMTPMITAYSYETMADATDRMASAGQSWAVVVDGMGQVVGIITETDIQRYFSLWIRYLDNDESVLDEIFDTNPYSQLHLDRDYFHQVGKHATRDVITVPEDATLGEAGFVFSQNPGIHHLVVVDDDGKPIGGFESGKLYSELNVSNFFNRPPTGN